MATTQLESSSPTHSLDDTSSAESTAGPVVYFTELGRFFNTSIEKALTDSCLKSMEGKVDLIFTSPPFPLRKKKRYGNLTGTAYVEWLKSLAKPLARLLSARGSIVMEIGNAWEEGPTMSTLPVEALLAFKSEAKLKLCQQFVCHNPARLPGPAQWVNIERIRVKDSFTNVWWLSKTERPKADNRKVLNEYSDSMRALLRKGAYNSGPRPSGWTISDDAFLKDNGGAIPPNVLTFSGTSWNTDDYLRYCRDSHLSPHPARMQPGLAEFFVRMLTDEGDLVLDPFAGSNTTGAVAERQKRRWLSIEPCLEYIQGSIGRFSRIETTTPKSPQADTSR